MGFDDELSALCARHLAKARRDNDLAGDMVEALSRNLGVSIAVVAGGDSKRIAYIIDGCEPYIAASASDAAKLGDFLGKLEAR